jgi:OmpA-OmpF porin, OOP family
MHRRAAGALLSLVLALPARAQPPEVDLSLFRPASGSDGTIGVEGARPLPERVDPIEVQFVLDGAIDPVRSGPVLIDRRLGGWFSMQGRVDPRLSLFVQVPVTFNEEGDFNALGAVPGWGVGDVRVGVRGSLVAERRLAVAAHLAFELATSQPGALTGDARLGVEALVSASRRLSDRLEVLGNALARFRPPRDFGLGRLGNEIGMRGAGIYSLSRVFRTYLELEARTSLRDLSFASAPAEWRIGARACAFGRLAFDAAAGTRLDAALGAPDFRALLSVRYAPADCSVPAAAPEVPVDALLAELAAARAVRDALASAEQTAAAHAGKVASGDALKESEEQAAAHGRAVRHADEMDSDDDGIPDMLDNCPFEKGPVINRGCPMSQRQKVALREDRIDILDKVRFATGSARIRSQSFAMLDQIVRVLKTHPDLVKIQVEGHTDATGSARLNTALSQARAESVVNYLVEHGVERARFVARGFGPSRPLGSNVTRAGREANRRVEFRVLDRQPILEQPEGQRR